MLRGTGELDADAADVATHRATTHNKRITQRIASKRSRK
jgi:hypothetical protein